MQTTEKKSLSRERNVTVKRNNSKMPVKNTQ